MSFFGDTYTIIFGILYSLGLSHQLKTNEPLCHTLVYLQAPVIVKISAVAETFITQTRLLLAEAIQDTSNQ